MRTQLYTEQRKFKQKMAYACNLAIPYAVIIGDDELAEGEVSLKDMSSGEQTRCTPENAASRCAGRAEGPLRPKNS